MIEYHTFSEFRDSVEELQAPEDLAENLEPYFRDQVAGALADLQTFLPWLRSFNVNFYEKGDVQEFCNASIFQGPVGKPTQLFAYKTNVDCKKLHYKKATVAQLDCWMERQRCLCPATEPPASNIYDSPYCNYVINGEAGCSTPYLTATEDDCRFKGLDDDNRMYAVAPDYKIIAAPRFPCGYILCLQWQGIRRKWENTDLVPVDQQLREAVSNFVEWKMALKARIHDSAELFRREYQNSLRILRYRYKDEQDGEAERDCAMSFIQSMPLFLPAYMTPVYGPTGSGTINQESGVPLLLE